LKVFYAVIDQTLSSTVALQDGLDEPRLILEDGIPARICALIAPVLHHIGLRVVRIRITGGSEGAVLQIMAEKADGTMTIEDCEAASKAISPILDLEDPITSAYRLEISSPGLDRPLVRLSDFITWQNHLARIDMSVPHDGRKRFKGILRGVDGLSAKLELEDPKAGQDPIAVLPIADMDEARLILTDELIRAALKAGKAKFQDQDDDTFDAVELDSDEPLALKAPKRTKAPRKKPKSPKRD
jgi:ribosome maturation factor RimP